MKVKQVQFNRNDRMPKCLSITLINSVLKKHKNYCLQVFLEKYN